MSFLQSTLKPDSSFSKPNQALTDMMMYGAAGPAGQYASNLAQFGVASEGSGRPLADLAYGYATGPATYLAPFLKAQAEGARAPGNYKAPTIPAKGGK